MKLFLADFSSPAHRWGKGVCSLIEWAGIGGGTWPHLVPLIALFTFSLQSQVQLNDSIFHSTKKAVKNLKCV